jgi:hypothetical protein
MTKIYPLRSKEKRKKYNDDSDNNITIAEKDEFRLVKPIKLLDEQVIRLKDKKLTPLKQYMRPYFSPYYNSWEIDFMIVPYKTNTFFMYKKPGTFYYLFAININTKYLCVYPSHKRDTNIVVYAIEDMLKNNIRIDNIRGDFDVAFRNQLQHYLKDKKIGYFFTSFEFTNRNKVVDRVMRTIRDMFEQYGDVPELLCDVRLMKYVVNKYNNTKHSAFDHRFTPNQVQQSHELESFFIRKQNLKLDLLNIDKFIHYKPGNALMICIPWKDIGYKRRRNFTHLAEFIRYEYGNVLCKIILPPVQLDDYDTLLLPMYYTDYVADTIPLALEIPEIYRYFYLYLKKWKKNISIVPLI